MRSQILILAMFLSFESSAANASLISTGPKGINSRSKVLRLPDGDSPLTGLGVNIGQVEQARPGWPIESGGPDDEDHSNSSVRPTDVVKSAGDAVDENEAVGMGHATQVAGVMISKDTTDSNSPANGDDPRGVAPDASLYASAYIVAGAGAGYSEALLATQYIAQVPDMRAINHSWQKPFPPGGAPLDGMNQLTLGMDWIAYTYDVLNIVGGDEGAMQPVPKDNFNGMTIAASSLEGGKYARVASLNTIDEDAEDLRTSISLMAPGQDVELSTFGDGESAEDDGTSFAAPHVTGTVALLQQFANAKNGTAGWNKDHTKRHEVMKAVLLNSADKIKDAGDGKYLGMERTVIDEDGKNWLQSEAYLDKDTPFIPGLWALDDQMGAGHLNAKRALQQFVPGEVDPDAGVVPSIGWDYGHTSGLNNINRYVWVNHLSRAISFRLQLLGTAKWNLTLI